LYAWYDEYLENGGDIPPQSKRRRYSDEQKRVAVDILDRFDTLTKSLTDGIPAEIEARRAQYGYYRDRLLDFPRKAGATRSMFCILDIGSMST